MTAPCDAAPMARRLTYRIHWIMTARGPRLLLLCPPAEPRIRALVGRLEEHGVIYEGAAEHTGETRDLTAVTYGNERCLVQRIPSDIDRDAPALARLLPKGAHAITGWGPVYDRVHTLARAGLARLTGGPVEVRPGFWDEVIAEVPGSARAA